VAELERVLAEVSLPKPADARLAGTQVS
jgi:hypothetical protein